MMNLRRFPLWLGLTLALCGAGGAVFAQADKTEKAEKAEKADTSGQPIDSSGSFEVGGVDVDVAAGSSEAARLAGWRLAQRKGWDMLSRRMTGQAGSLPDSALDSMVTGIVVEQEQIGGNRYVARLGVLFSRSKAAAVLGVSGQLTRSQPMLLIPIEWSGGTGTAFEQDSEWRAAWVRFRTGNSAIDYVRPSGTGADSLLFNAGQVLRRGRGWWRTILNQYGAVDVLVPQVRLSRQWPGGPVIGVFTADHGPDNRPITQFTLRVANADGIPALLDEGVRRIDAAYQAALVRGTLRTDPLLTWTPPVRVAAETEVKPEEETLTVDPTAVRPGTVAGTTISIQVDTPTSGAVLASESALRAIPGVRAASTDSLALGGLSVMRVTFDGNIASLRAALEARGWLVQEGGGTLRIRRALAPPPPVGATPAAGTPTGG